MKTQQAELEVLASSRTWLLIVGLGLMLCYSATSSLAALHTPPVDVAGIAPRWFTVAGLLVEAATFVALAVISLRKPPDASLGRAAVVFSALGCAVFAAAQCFAIETGTWGPPLAPIFFKCLVRGICPAVLWICWAEMLARFDVRHVLVSYIVASALSAVLTLLASQLPAFVLAVAGGVAVLASATSLIALGRVPAGMQVEGEDGSYGKREGSWPFPAAPILLMAVFTFASVFARNVLELENRGVVDAGVIVAMLLLIVFLALHTSRFDPWDLCAVAFPVTLCGLFCLGDATGSLGTFASVCIHAGDALFAVFMAAMLCNISYRWGVPAAFLFGCAKAAGTLASLCGGFASSYVGGLDSGGPTLFLACVGTALAVCYVHFGNASRKEKSWGIPQEEAAHGESGIAGKEEGLRDTCACLAYRFGLTRREEQVLCLLARGLTAAEIQEELSVSNSTVKTHTSAVFRKMNAHSRKEIADLVERAR